MGKCLVVANQTLGGDQLMGEVRRRMATGPSSFYVVVPNTRPAEIIRLLGEPAPFATAESEAQHRATLTAQSRLHQALAQLRAEGADAQGHRRLRVRLDQFPQLRFHAIDDDGVRTQYPTCQI